MGRHVNGGILSALTILKDHWGACGRDLACAGYAWDDICGRLPFSQFLQLIVYAPPSSAVYYAQYKGWTPELYKITDLVDGVNWLVWSKTETAQDNPRQPPAPSWRPGDPVPDDTPAMTIRDYMRLAGMEGADDD